LLKEQGKDYLLGEVYEQCQRARAEGIPINFVKRLYEEFEYEQVSDKIADIVRPEGMKAELQVVYQTVENLHKAIPNHSGDWYFTGNFPTPGGMKVANKSYMNYMDGKLVRAY
jgi:amidophosphoribosyltransferase